MDPTRKCLELELQLKEQQLQLVLARKDAEMARKDAELARNYAIKLAKKTEEKETEQVLTLYKLEREGTTYVQVVFGQKLATISPWYRNCREVMRYDCVHSESWNHCKQLNFKFFYGTQFRPGSPNTFRSLSESELVEKYRQQEANVEIPNEAVLMNYCFTPQEQLVQRTHDIICRQLLAERMGENFF